MGTSQRASDRKDRTMPALLAAYYLTAVLFILFSLFPYGRVWGFNLLAFFSPWLVYSGALVLLTAPVAVLIVARRFESKVSDETARQSSAFLWFSVTFTVVAVVLFYLLRATTHFDGDGYLLLGNLYNGTLLINYHSYGSMGLQVLLYSVLGKAGEPAALLAYQLVSYVSGAIFVIVAGMTAAVLLESLRDRILFFLGMMVGGYSLQFFGYVENYSLFISTVAIYLLVGILVVKERSPRWTIALVNLLALFFHIFGLILVPASIYILFRKTRISARLHASSMSVKIALIAASMVIPVGVFTYFFLTNYYFRFAFLPLVSDRLTASGYTIFSVKHLLDIVNLLIMLCPGLLVYVIGWRAGERSRNASTDIITFLLLAAGFGLIAVLVFDPKLGMARDWDVFAFVGVPLNVILLLLVLKSRTSVRLRVVAVSTAIILGAVFLAARVGIKTDDPVAIERLRAITPLDPVRGGKNGLLISKYYFDHGDSLRGYQEDSLWDRSKKDFLVIAYGKALFDSGRVQVAMSAYRQAITINPFNPAAYNNLAQCFIRYRQLDSAKEYLLIAQGMQPGDSYVLSNLGWIAYQQHENRRAEELWLKSIKADSTFAAPRILLLQMYQIEKKPDKYLEQLLALARYPDAPPDKLTEAAAYYCRQGRLSEARDLLARARTNGLDSAQYIQFLNQYPGLRENP